MIDGGKRAGWICRWPRSPPENASFLSHPNALHVFCFILSSTKSRKIYMYIYMYIYIFFGGGRSKFVFMVFFAPPFFIFFSEPWSACFVLHIMLAVGCAIILRLEEGQLRACSCFSRTTQKTFPPFNRFPYSQQDADRGKA